MDEKSSGRTTWEARIKLDKYYICNICDLGKPRLLRYHFKSIDQALSYIINYKGWDVKNYIILSAEDASKYKLKFFTLPQRKIFVENYDYPYERVTYQKKKTYRTIMRRRLRAIMKKLDNTE